MNGWIKLHRKLLEKAFYCKDSEKVHLWVHLLLKANHSDYEEMLGGKPIICKSGQFTTGRKQLSLETGISESKVERILTYFEKIEQQIEQQKTSTNRLISICKWSEYQESEQQIEQRVNNDRTTSEQRVNTLQEDKEEKKYKNNIEQNKILLRNKASKFREKIFQLKNEFNDEKTLQAFFEYWCEPNKSFTKMKYEGEKTWELRLRLKRWFDNNEKFSPSKNNLKHLNQAAKRDSDYN